MFMQTTWNLKNAGATNEVKEISNVKQKLKGIRLTQFLELSFFLENISDRCALAAEQKRARMDVTHVIHNCDLAS